MKRKIIFLGLFSFLISFRSFADSEESLAFNLEQELQRLEKEEFQREDQQLKAAETLTDELQAQTLPATDLVDEVNMNNSAPVRDSSLPDTQLSSKLNQLKPRRIRSR